MDSPFTDVTNRLDFSSGRLSNRKPAKRVRKSVFVATSKTKRSCRRSDFMVPGDLTAQSSIHNPTQQIPTIPLDVTTRLDIPSGPVTYKEPARRVGKTDTAVTSKRRRSRRRADFTVSGELNAQSSIHNPTQHMPTIPSEYADFGEINCCCQHCGAQFWFAERAEKSTNATHPKFPVCCINGKISLPFFQQPPELLSNLFSGNDPRSRNFLDHIRTYNSMFAFTSLGGKVDGNMNNGGGPPQFVISGQNYHRIGSLLPNEGDVPKFAQLYIYDTQNEVANRMAHFGDNTGRSGRSNIDPSLVEDLIKMVDDSNKLAKSFRRVRDHLEEGGAPDVALRLFKHGSQNRHTYNLPSVDEVAALIVGDFDSSDCGRDVIIRTKTAFLQRISENHMAFLPLQYPIIFPFGTNGYSDDIPFAKESGKEGGWKRNHVSLREWAAFRLQERQDEFNGLLLSRRLLQQFVVDCYSMIESYKLLFYRRNQHIIRKEILSGIQEAVDRGDTNSSTIGARIILPSSFTGGRRFMFNKCQDAMAICRTFGYPDLFIKMTCNPKWPEIERHIANFGLLAFERPDIACRVFRAKLDQFMIDLKRENSLEK